MSRYEDTARTPFKAQSLPGKVFHAEKGYVIVNGERLVCACGQSIFFYHLMTFTPNTGNESYIGGGFIQCEECKTLYEAPKDYEEIVQTG